ncbi:bifunctional glutamate N-acetyltransferase/amino-acid acetyltransferase ArgJ [Haloechinothrix sp. LS1_15]|uniref:bifunctional glutamate N-acetyltransferase/amino-acid acetyltransferase ArgJ n=1 Tax=Haloechinothrix sp. LS1_15 TaxID=2652248 RepID=UPI002947495D|nr:bifunctional glutamate N-acetyltransferase/amino-acid acetyltransferase ArgJ [Haloechinothrix sp. LS1_15]MDV6012266.1 bifunctional glutamate N-acetyltransferase/amino-acid acetyltransferase ArgJ [Haloechinothrix sp. LS1_15]
MSSVDAPGTGLTPVPVDGVDVTAGVTAPAGFRAAGIAAGIKEDGRDLALVVNDGPSLAAAGVFTRNAVKAAPVLWSRQVLRERRLRAVVLNSGCANAATGPLGFQDTHATAEKVAEVLDTGAIEVAVCSTGLIGERLPMDAVLGGIVRCAGELSAGQHAAYEAADAVRTTDGKPKQAALRHSAGWTIGGFAKGAGMLAPNMATMLSVITTDAKLDGDVLDSALRTASGATFERLDVDGGTSTNDTVLLLSSGASDVVPEAGEFTAALSEVSLSLVRQLQADAEGATKLVDIVVRGARSEADAVQVGRTVAEDNLVKTALFGSDPNWGRVAMAVGRSQAEVDPDRLAVTLNGVSLLAGGEPVGDRAAADLTGTRVEIVIDLGIGSGTTRIYTTDLSHDYVEENSAYSS